MGVIMGTESSDLLDGTGDGDQILGKGGNDILNGLAGDDRIFGGFGGDELYGGLGDDVLSGDKGDDVLSGGSGNDNLDGGLGWDVAEFSDSVRNYDVSFGRGRWTIAHTRGTGADGTDEVRKVEELRFADGIVYLDGQNNAPIAADDSAAVGEDGPAIVVDVLANDWDFEGDPLTVTALDTFATIGTVTLNPDGSTTYDPNVQFEYLGQGETAIDTYTYTVSDGKGGSDTATVTVMIEGVADGPVRDFDAFIVHASTTTGPGEPNEVWFNDGHGNFINSGQELGETSSYSVALGDVDGDGDLDAFVANINYPGEPNHVWFNDGDGAFTDSGQLLGAGISTDVALGDLDADGDLDAFVTNEEPYSTVWFNDGVGNFTDSGQALAGFDQIGIKLGDLDADGDLDAFVAVSASVDSRNKVWLNDGAGNFIDSGQNLSPEYQSADVALGDLDGDGDLDAFVANVAVAGPSGPSPNQVWLNDGHANFADSGQALGISASRNVALGDLDADGDLDAFIANALGSGSPLADSVWFNDGVGNFTDSGQALGNEESYDVALADLDNDGDIDAFVATAGNTGPNRIWLNNGTGIFTDSGQVFAASNFVGVALGDLDGDGDTLLPDDPAWLL